MCCPETKKKQKQKQKNPTQNETCNESFTFLALLMKTKQGSLHLISNYTVSE